MARQRVWLIATVAAFFALHAPLCAFACLESPAAAQTAAQEAEHPCHEQRPASTPADAPTSHEDGSCALACEALLPSSDTPTNLSALAILPLSAPSAACYSGLVFAQAVPRDADLPPPDILLLNSTLLI
jgi:hypothetical protein